MSLWIGIVKEIQDDNSIQFDIEGLDSFSTKPIAYPSEAVTYKPEKGNRVLIEQPDDAVQAFLYRTLGDKNIWIKNNNAVIDISDEDNCTLKFPNFSIEASSNNVSIRIGNMKITSTDTGVSIEGAGASLTINGIVTGTVLGGPFLSEQGSKVLEAAAKLVNIPGPCSGNKITLT